MDQSDINFTDCSDDEPPKKKTRVKPKKKAKIHWSKRRWMDVSSDDNPKLMTAEDYAEKYDTDVESESAPESKSDSERITESESESQSESEPENIKSQTVKSSQTEQKSQNFSCKNNNTLGYARRIA